MAYRIGTPGPPWRRTIVADFTLSALSAGAMWVGGAARLFAGEEDAWRAATWFGFPCVAAALAVLVHDLGRPRRFHHMVMAFNPTSPMSWGVYIVSLHAFIAFAALVFPGWRAPAWASLVVAPAVLGYKGLLLSATAVPFWRTGRAFGPLLVVAGLLFGASALALAGVRAELLAGPIAAAGLLQALLAAGVWRGAGPESTMRPLHSTLFWAGGVVFGGALPAVLVALRDVPLAALCALAGGVALRWALLRGPVTA
jgi:hypothetical protein